MATESLWVNCQVCGKKISKSARSCPHCGARRSKLRALKWVGVGLVAVVALSALIGRDGPKSNSSQATGSAGSVKGSQTVPSTPEQQKRFLAETAAFSERFSTASNELQQSTLRDERRESIKQVLGEQREVVGWIGTIKRLETNSEGRAILAVRLSENTDLVTWNNALLDLSDGTLIDKGTPLFDSLRNMSVGDKVTVTGTFLSSDVDWVRERSITIRGSMMNPEFLFRFHTVVQQ